MRELRIDDVVYFYQLMYLLDFLSISRFVFQLIGIIENQFVSHISDPKAAKIKVQKPTIIAQEGSVATLSVYIYGDPRPDVYWKKGSREIDVRRGKYKIVNGGSLQVILLTFLSLEIFM